MTDDTVEIPLTSASGGRRDTVEAFGLLSNEIRIATLLALWDAKEPWEDQPGLSFSELYGEVAVDDTGQFNYHLDKLTPRFVAEDNGSYTLTLTGFKLVQAVIAGVGDTGTELAETAVDRDCPFCGEPIRVRYDHGVVVLYCTHCDGRGRTEIGGDQRGFLLGDMLPPAGLEDRTPAEVVDATVTQFLNRFDTMRSGVCTDCGGPVQSTLRVCSDHDADDTPCSACNQVAAGWINCLCDVCARGSGAPAWLAVQTQPPVAGLLYESGDWSDDPWEQKELGIGLGYTETVVSTAPPELRIAVEIDGSHVTATIDGGGTITTVAVD